MIGDQHRTRSWRAEGWFQVTTEYAHEQEKLDYEELEGRIIEVLRAEGITFQGLCVFEMFPG